METSTEETSKIVSLAEVKNMLKKISKERKELLYEQKIALEHAETLCETNQRPNHGINET
jgi:DNA-directed RNA polymerase subunit F